MEQGQDFYITLPSNASADVYPANKIWNYRIKLAKPIILKQPYQVGVIELQYPKSWISFPEEDSVIMFSVHKAGAKPWVKLKMPVGHYDTIPRVIKEINNLFVKQTKTVSMLYNAVTNRVFFMGDENGSVVFRGRLAHILGFVPNQEYAITPSNHPIQYAPHPADIYGGCYNMFVYTDIVDYQRVGDTYVPLLRSINITDDARRIPTLVYDKPHYTSVSKAVIDDIEISIKNDQNHYIPFTYGKVFIKLHFRPVRDNF